MSYLILGLSAEAGLVTRQNIDKLGGWWGKDYIGTDATGFLDNQRHVKTC